MFELLLQDPSTKARRGRLNTRRGIVETPIFMPVGTQGTVKAVSPSELLDLQTQIILGNTYHLYLRPGLEIIEHFGGLHRFMAWPAPILTDSGGFQVFSLAKLRKITEEGVHFQNHLDGSPCFIGPEIAMNIQAALGSDIAMTFDECPPYPCEYEYAASSLERTLRWAERCRAWADEHEHRPAVFGIVQGSSFSNLRQQAAEVMTSLGFDGYAIGGVSVGEPEEEMMRAIEDCEPLLPAHKARYAMGLGTPPQIVEMVARGVDMFDCVLPTRLARNGTAFTANGTLSLKNAAFARDTGPIEEECGCPACKSFTRGYLRHLVKAEEILGLRLITQHNLFFYLGLMKKIRMALENGTFPAFRRHFLGNYRTRADQTPAAAG